MPGFSESAAASSDSNTSSPESGSSSSEKITLERLNTQIDWYDRRSRLNKTLFKLLKTVTLLGATAIPVVTTSTMAHGSQLAAALGLLITMLETVQQLNQYQANWIAYRATAESLKHEKYLYLGAAGIYSKSASPRTLLAERVELLVSEENSKWLMSQNQTGVNDQSTPARIA